MRTVKPSAKKSEEQWEEWLEGMAMRFLACAGILFLVFSCSQSQNPPPPLFHAGAQNLNSQNQNGAPSNPKTLGESIVEFGVRPHFSKGVLQAISVGLRYYDGSNLVDDVLVSNLSDNNLTSARSPQHLMGTLECDNSDCSDNKVTLKRVTGDAAEGVLITTKHYRYRSQSPIRQPRGGVNTPLTTVLADDFNSGNWINTHVYISNVTGGSTLFQIMADVIDGTAPSVPGRFDIKRIHLTGSVAPNTLVACHSRFVSYPSTRQADRLFQANRPYEPGSKFPANVELEPESGSITIAFNSMDHIDLYPRAPLETNTETRDTNNER